MKFRQEASPIRKSRFGFTFACWRPHSSSNRSIQPRKTMHRSLHKAHPSYQLFFFHFASPIEQQRRAAVGSAPGTFKRRACNENGAERPRKQINTNSSRPPEERESGLWLHLPTVGKASMGVERKGRNKKGAKSGSKYCLKYTRA